MSVEVTLNASSVPPTNQQQQQQQQQENPFQEDGELRRKADYIISHSRISRTEVQIVDPDSPQPTTTTLVTPSDGGHGTLTEEESVEAPVERSKVTEVHSNPPVAAGGGAANGSVQEPVTVVEVEVKSAETKTDDRPQTAEQVKLKSKKKCCSVQ